MKTVLIILTSLLCTACQSLKISTNAGDYLINSANQGLSSSEVIEMRYPQLYQYNFLPKGVVEAVSCTYERFDNLPSEEYMRKKLKKNAFDIGANVIVFDSCLVRHEFQDCKKHFYCRGESFLAEL